MSKNIFANLSIDNDSNESSITMTSSDVKVVSKDTTKVSSWNAAKTAALFATENTEVKNRPFNISVEDTVSKLKEGGWIPVTSKKKKTADVTNSKKVGKSDKDNKSNGGYKGRQHKDNSKTNDKQNTKQNSSKDNSAKSVSSNASKEQVEKASPVVEQPMVTRKMPDTKPSYANMATKPAVPQPKPVSKPEDAIPFKTKSFTKTVAKPVENKVNEPLPEHYTKRDDNNEFQVQFNAAVFIKKVAGIEKSTNNQNMYQSILNCAIEYYSKPEYMMNTTFFRSKMGIDNESQERVFMLVFVQVISLLVHRLIRSDSVDIIKAIFQNLPLFDAVSDQHIRRTGDAKANENLGIVVYERIRNRWISDMKIIKNISKRSDEEYFVELEKATERTESMKKMLFDHLFQSEWNQNNLFHSAMYYGASKTMNELIKLGTERKMYSQLNKMLTVKNGINETYGDILTSGLADAEKNDKRNNVSNILFRKKAFDECRRLYGLCMEVLRAHSASLIEKEANAILSESGIDIDDDVSIPNIEMPNISSDVNVEPTSGVSNDFDDTNTIEMLQSGNMEGMIDYIIKNHKLGNVQNIRSTVGIWTNIATSDSQYSDYLEDVLECADLSDIMIEIFPERFDVNSANSSA